MTIGGTVDVEKKPNTPVSTTDYATKTKPSVYEVITFIATEASNKPTLFGQTESVTGGTYYTSTPNSGASCAYYTTGMSLSARTDGKSLCYVEQRETNKVYNGGTNPLNGSTETLWGGTINIDDVPIGTKFCIAVSVWPADSHNNPTANSTGADNDPSMNTGTGYWQHTPPKCYDVAKKPNTQIWGNDIFAGSGTITTSQSKKRFYGSAYYTFGSWAEYAAISNSPIMGLGSGAAFGYNNHSAANGATNSGNYLTTGKPGGFPTGATAANPCQYSKSTISNSGCPTPVLGNAKIADGSLNLTTARLLARYASAATTAELVKEASCDAGYTCIDLSKQVLKDGTNKFSVSGNVKLVGNWNIPAKKTVILTATGTAKIATNIVYPDGPYGAMADLPQVLLFAGDIKITDNVTNIDSWLIAGKLATGGTGTVHTCDGYTVGSNLDGYTCANQLTINGPIFATKLITVRTAGAGVGNASIDPGEVFNLRPDTYLWATAQAQNFRQAVVTHTKNLPVKW
jgi:hypothetical protein